MSVLSKQWRPLWKMVPNLNFVYHGTNDLETFSDNVCKTLLSHKAPVLQRLHLIVSFDEGQSMDLGVYLLVGMVFGVGLHVREFKLEVYCEEWSFRFPRSLYNCETLETMELKALCGSIFVHVPSPVCLKSLRILHLHEVGYKDDESVVNLLSGCFRLETLVVTRSGNDDVKTFTIAVPSLQRLTIIDEFDSSVYVINCPVLKYLKTEARSGIGSCLIENEPELVEAHIDINDVINGNILGLLSSAKHLSLKISPVEIPFPTGSNFYQLVHLEICTYKADWWNLLTLMLDNSPNIQTLKLIGFRKSYQWDTVLGEKWNQPKSIPECLEILVWTCYGWKVEEEKEVAKYILRNASRLKRASFSEIEINSQARVEMVNELENVVRASNSCQLLFKYWCGHVTNGK